MIELKCFRHKEYKEIYLSVDERNTLIPTNDIGHALSNFTNVKNKVGCFEGKYRFALFESCKYVSDKDGYCGELTKSVYVSFKDFEEVTFIEVDVTPVDVTPFE